MFGDAGSPPSVCESRAQPLGRDADPCDAEGLRRAGASDVETVSSTAAPAHGCMPPPATPSREGLLTLVDGKQTGTDDDAAVMGRSLSAEDVRTMGTRDVRRAPPLVLAAKQGWIRTIRALLEAGVSVNQGDGHWGRTAFWEAASFGHVAVLQCLVDAAADPHQTPWKGKPCGVTPLQIATQQNRTETVAWLRNYYESQL